MLTDLHSSASGQVIFVKVMIMDHNLLDGMTVGAAVRACQLLGVLVLHTTCSLFGILVSRAVFCNRRMCIMEISSPFELGDCYSRRH